MAATLHHNGKRGSAVRLEHDLLAVGVDLLAIATIAAANDARCVGVHERRRRADDDDL